MSIAIGTLMAAAVYQADSGSVNFGVVARFKCDVNSSTDDDSDQEVLIAIFVYFSAST
jgi:hypothetical protein